MVFVGYLNRSTVHGDGEKYGRELGKLFAEETTPQIRYYQAGQSICSLIFATWLAVNEHGSILSGHCISNGISGEQKGWLLSRCGLTFKQDFVNFWCWYRLFMGIWPRGMFYYLLKTMEWSPNLLILDTPAGCMVERITDHVTLWDFAQLLLPYVIFRLETVSHVSFASFLHRKMFFCLGHGPHPSYVVERFRRRRMCGPLGSQFGRFSA